MATHRGKFIAYYRVSTVQQGRSGLGLEAQQKAVRDYLNGGPWELVGEFQEVESGRASDKRRPQLAVALAACKKQKATLIVAKLDRLSRDVRLLLELVDGGVPVRFVDLPELPDGAMGRFMLVLMASLAELEARRTGERTKAALAAAKARGVKLGAMGPVNLRPNIEERQARADDYARKVGPVITDMRQRGLSLPRIAAELNSLGIASPRGGKWFAKSVSRTLARLP